MTKLLPRRDVEAITRMPVSTIYKWMREGKFPRPIRLGQGERAPVMWREDDIQQFIEELTAKRGDAYREGPLESTGAATKRRARSKSDVTSRVIDAGVAA
jgi:prophage regulatory protein